MTDALVSPSRTVRIAGRDYRLDGSFATLRAVQEHFKRDVVIVWAGILDMRLDEVAALIAIGAGGKADEIGQAVVDSMDVFDLRASADYYLLKSELVAWLAVAAAPKADREKKSAEFEAMLERQKSGSPGPNTSGSPSASSDGSPGNSGAATSGS
jgi:hypothetical protein